MKLAAYWLLGLALAAAGCSVSHRSGDFTCERQMDCASGRTCIDGFCVAPQADASVPGDARVLIDAAPPSDANLCPSVCTSCSNDTTTCNIDCQRNGGACNGPIKCPEGWDCNVLCSTINSCRNGVTCPAGRPCNITCSGRMSCSKFACGSGACAIECTGLDSCTDLSCGTACACDITCGISASCNGLTCKSEDCTLRRGCTSLSLPTTLCNTCFPF
jgi:hypothetical protein